MTVNSRNSIIRMSFREFIYMLDRIFIEMLYPPKNERYQSFFISLSDISKTEPGDVAGEAGD